MTKGYRLHFEGEEGEPAQYRTMAEVRQAIRELAHECEITVKACTEMAYVLTEEEYQVLRKEEEQVKRDKTQQ